jgi:hypothetical protein
LDLRKEADKIPPGILSKLTKLIGDFKDASDLNNIVKYIEKDNAEATKDKQRKLWEETYY